MRRQDDEWLPMTDDELGAWRAWLVRELMDRMAKGKPATEQAMVRLKLEGHDTDSLGWLLHHFDD